MTRAAKAAKRASAAAKAGAGIEFISTKFISIFLELHLLVAVVLLIAHAQYCSVASDSLGAKKKGKGSAEVKVPDTVMRVAACVRARFWRANLMRFDFRLRRKIKSSRTVRDRASTPLLALLRSIFAPFFCISTKCFGDARGICREDEEEELLRTLLRRRGEKEAQVDKERREHEEKSRRFARVLRARQACVASRPNPRAV